MLIICNEACLLDYDHKLSILFALFHPKWTPNILIRKFIDGENKDYNQGPHISNASLRDY